MERLRCDAALVTHMPNVRYLCGFTGSSGVLAFKNGKFAFFTDGRYTTQAREEVAGATVRTGKNPALAEAAAWLQKQLGRRRGAVLAIEGEHMTVSARERLVAVLKSVGAKLRLKPTSGVVEGLRVVKEPEEQQKIRTAILLASGLFPGLVASLGPGVAEATVAAELEFHARKAGAEKMAFDTLVASGLRSAMPHARASAKPLPTRGFVIMDYGVILGGYHSDMTRTVHLGAPDERARGMYHAVLEANEAAIAAVRAGVTAESIDEAARRVLRRAKLEKYFTHSCGHGVGLEIHEPPRLGKGQQQLLEEGMVITIEPGAYVPGYGGVRIEDVVRVTANGCEVLTPTSKSFVTV